MLMYQFWEFLLDFNCFDHVHDFNCDASFMFALIHYSSIDVCVVYRIRDSVLHQLTDLPNLELVYQITGVWAGEYYAHC